MRGLNPIIIAAITLGILTLAMLYIYSINMTVSFAQWVPQRIAAYIATNIAMNDKITVEKSVTLGYKEEANNGEKKKIKCKLEEPKRNIPGFIDENKLIKYINNGEEKNKYDTELFPIIPSYSYIVYFQYFDNGWHEIGKVEIGNFDENKLINTINNLVSSQGVISEKIKNAKTFAELMEKILDFMDKGMEHSTLSSNQQNIKEKEILPSPMKKLTWFYPEFYVMNIDLSSIFENKNEENSNENKIAREIIEICNLLKEEYKEKNKKIQRYYDVGIGYSFLCSTKSMGLYIYPVVFKIQEEDGYHNKFGRIIILVIPIGDEENIGERIKAWTKLLDKAYVFVKLHTGG